MPKLDRAALAKRSLFDGVHFPLEARKLSGARIISADEKECRPEDDHTHRGHDGIGGKTWETMSVDEKFEYLRDQSILFAKQANGLIQELRSRIESLEGAKGSK